MGWFRERRKLKLFTRALQQTSTEQFSNGVISSNTLAKIDKAVKKPQVMRKLMKQTEVEPGLYGGISDWNWASILNWVQTFFIPLVKALLPLVLLLDEEK